MEYWFIFSNMDMEMALVENYKLDCEVLLEVYYINILTLLTSPLHLLSSLIYITYTTNFLTHGLPSCALAAPTDNSHTRDHMPGAGM